MRIAIKFRIVTLLAVLLATLVAFVLIGAFNRVHDQIGRLRQTDRFLKSVFELKVVTEDYLETGLPRANAQWHAKSATLLGQLREIAFNTDEQRALARRIQANHTSLGRTFREIETTAAGDATPEAVMIRRLTANLDVALLAMTSSANQLLEVIYRDLVKGQRIATTVAAFSSIAMLGMIVALGAMIRRGALRPLQRLQRDTAIIGEGNLDYRVGYDADDELGDLSRAFDGMLTRLKRVTASRDELNREVAERRRVETELRTTLTALEQSNRDLEQFAYSASHDLQEPLRKVAAFGSLLKKEYADAIGEQGNQYVSIMCDATGRMQKLISALLSYSRVTTRGKAFVPVDLNDAVATVLSDLETRISETKGDIVVGRLPTIQADPAQIRQLLQNLIANALKFHKPDEAPRVQVYDDSIVEGDPSAMPLCRISVEDNGIGFEQKYADRIFGIFQRLHTRREYSGTGIGLAVCRRIAERHGGCVAAVSAPGNGARFTFTLPLARDTSQGDKT